MELDYIREFVTLAESENYLEAAETLFIAQSTLSKHIKSIESDLGAPLFDRTTRKVKLNSFGAAFLPYAQKMTQLQDEYTAVLSSQLADSNSRITIASIPVMTQYHINEVLAEFQLSAPHIRLDIIEADSAQMREMLTTEKCDFGFLREINDGDDEFQTITFDTDYVAAVLPSSHPLAKNNFVTLEQLKDENFFFLSKGTLMYSLCYEACQRSGFTPRVTFTSHRAANIIDLVRKGMGVALLTKQPAVAFADSSVSIVDLVPYLKTSIRLAYLKGRKLSAPSKQFLSFVQNWSRRNPG